jgi:hypothetical protein
MKRLVSFDDDGASKMARHDGIGLKRDAPLTEI